MTRTDASTSEQPASLSTSDVIQIAGVIFSIIIAFVTDGSTTGQLVVGLAVGAAVLMTGTIWMASRGNWEKRKPRIVGQGFASLVLVVLAVCFPALLAPVTHESRQNTSSHPSASSAGKPRPFIERSGYTLRPSSSVLTNDQDKIDIDTGCPGWGDMHPHIGPSRCGELADLVADGDSIHTADGKPNIYNPPAGALATYATCRGASERTPTRGTDEVDSEALFDGESLCLVTDQGNLAAVHIDSVKIDSADQLVAVTIDFEAWHMLR